MKRTIFLLMSFFLLVGFSSSNPFFDSDGQLKEEHKQKMKAEWCEHNKNREFAKERCESLL